MSAYVKLSSKLEGDEEINGLDAQSPDLLANPDRLRCAVVWYDVQKIVTDTDTRTEVPTIRVRRIEPIGHAAEQPPALRKIVDKAVEDRTGRKPIPFETIEVGEAAYADPLVDQ